MATGSSAAVEAQGIDVYRLRIGPGLPYLLSILALIVMSRRAAYPKALLVPYRKGER